MAEIVSEKAECSICCSDVKRSSIINCQECIKNNQTQNNACIKCIKKYLIECNTDAHCMFCRNQWNNTFLKSVLPPTWLKGTYRSHMKKVYIDREKSLIPATLAVAEKEKQRLIKEKQAFDKKEEMRHKVDRLRAKFQQAKRDLCDSYRHLDDVKKSRPTIFALNETVVIDESSYNPKPKREIVTAKRYICPCPSPNDCKGMIQENNNTCIICGTIVCKKCFDIINTSIKEKHQCNETTLANMKDILSNTKPCPGCASRIFKIAGCDQMFCTQCKISFSWGDGSIIKEAIHNPHYFEWLAKMGNDDPMNRRNRINPGDGCDLRTYDQQAAFVRRVLENRNQLWVRYQEWNMINYTFNQTCALRDENIPKYRNQIPSESDYIEKRIMYIVGELSESRYVTWIMDAKKTTQSRLTVIDIFESLTEMLMERLVLICQVALQPQRTDEVVAQFEGYLDEMKKLREMANETIKTELELLDCKTMPRIAEPEEFYQEKRDNRRNKKQKVSSKEW